MCVKNERLVRLLEKELSVIRILIIELFFEFLLTERERIKRNTLIGPICNGGIKIVDTESKIIALKASWT